MCECPPYLGSEKGGGFCKHQHYICCGLSAKIVDLLRDPKFGSENNCTEAMVEDLGAQDIESGSDVIREGVHDQEIVKDQKSKVSDKNSAMRLAHSEKIKRCHAALLQLAKRMEDATDLGINKDCDDFVNEVDSFTSNILVPQKHTLKLNKERVHVPVAKIMGDYRKNVKKREEERKKAKQGGDAEHTIDPNFPLDMIWKNLIGNCPMDDENSPGWSSVLSLEFDRLNATLQKYYNKDSQDAFMDAYQKAKKAWYCAKCESYSAEKMEAGMIECYGCSNWFHKHADCVTPLEKDTSEKEQWQCQMSIQMKDGKKVHCKYILTETEDYYSDEEFEIANEKSKKKGPKSKKNDPYMMPNGLLLKEDVADKNQEKLSQIPGKSQTAKEKKQSKSQLGKEKKLPKSQSQSNDRKRQSSTKSQAKKSAKVQKKK